MLLATASVAADGEADVMTAINELTVESLISDLALILVLGAISTLIFKRLRQPIVLGYIVAGFLASPHMWLLPSVTSEANIEFWAQIGIVVLLFTLGLEFSFKKLMNVGGSAVVTALVIVAGMMTLGFVTGKVLGFGNIDSLFLGGMLSMSSTTIIIKAFSDLGVKHKRFASLVLAVLICEDLFAVVMMVLLSSVAINNSVESGEMLMSMLRLGFFLVIWFTVGVWGSLIYQTEKTMKDLADKMDSADKAKLESELADFKKVRESNDADQIKSAMESFSKATYDVFGKVYQQQAAEQQGNPGAQGGVNDDGTVDTEFTDSNN